MTTYWLSFTLDSRTISGKSYDDRWAALNTAINNISTNWWRETTAFIVFETDANLSQIVSDIKAVVSSSYDIVLIRSLDTKSARIIGPVKDQDIFKLMPYLERA
ncbi:hypothetical protein [Rhizobium sp. PP-CC-3G-465]|uniref:hypothetical protein n=1 Tax=Rhizobium sp. PP-CC-3G-465 TaxID=2135648 RepID=UPI0010500EB9|nr:hypothetical protein C8J33_103231 [Rhizobium sp. PP-CC-3G-465]